MNQTPGGLRVRIAAKRVEAVGICSFELVPTGGTVLPPFSAGAHIDVAVTPTLTRQYSLCNDPADTGRYQIAVLRDARSRGGSAAMHEQLQVGHEISISLPKDHFPLAHGAAKSVLVAGGIGVTPLLAMAQRLWATGADFVMHYCARSRERTAFVERIEASPFAACVHFHFDDGPEAQRFGMAAQLAAPEPGTHLYVCGPKGFMDAVLGTARASGWPEAQLHFEFFAAEVQASASDASFEVKLASSGRVVVVPPGSTVVRALAEAGVEIQTSCEQGVCGTCITRVLEGVPDHRDLYFTPEEQAANDQFTPCCSRARTSLLVLDL